MKELQENITKEFRRNNRIILFLCVLCMLMCIGTMLITAYLFDYLEETAALLTVVTVISTVLLYIICGKPKGPRAAIQNQTR